MSEEKKESLHAGALEIEKAIQKYYPETDSLVLKKLEEWQNLKFGLLMHWAPSSQWGIVESWSLCSEDEDWCKRDIEDYTEYKNKYEGLKKTFNPQQFDPSKWANAAKNAGMKYVVFTTKHHDGFCMYDSKFTDYKITDEECPYSSSPKANITKGIFDEFRNNDFMIGAYFSKPDWHSDYFWWKKFATPDRNANYDVKKHPDRWQKFVEFTHNQVDELVTDYGKVDILWFDGCWVRKYSDEEIIEERKISSLNIHRVQNQDIKMEEITRNAREKQPGIIVVDRAVAGPHQNYLTPENQVPDRTLPYPWETCMPITPSWSYEPGLVYKSVRQLIHTLVDVVAKGGNFLLNVAPTAEGDFEPAAYDRLTKIGEWMNINDEAIYNSKPILPYKENNICFTQLDDRTTFAIYLVDEAESSLPEKIVFNHFIPDENARIELLGTDIVFTGNKLDNSYEIEFPEDIRNKIPNKNAWSLKFIR
ncbi:MAG: alpha-L-fucosidase [Bacteroidetes bacterium]|nr:alpha-L-fucosidase [Bacteroidota bacterium]MBU1116431.1 alpha-L-fucosidase [Bacteroidota bacterium]MBU1800010.1 alpha-L-fucosidase [Bacteroidota bacterium]